VIQWVGVVCRRCRSAPGEHNLRSPPEARLPVEVWRRLVSHIAAITAITAIIPHHKCCRGEEASGYLSIITCTLLYCTRTIQTTMLIRAYTVLAHSSVR
jgi:hypothetical protein